MILKEWLTKSSKTERDRVATEAGTSVAYLYLIARGDRRPKIALAQKIVSATNNEVTMQDLRPDIFAVLVA